MATTRTRTESSTTFLCHLHISPAPRVTTLLSGHYCVNFQFDMQEGEQDVKDPYVLVSVCVGHGQYGKWQKVSTVAETM